MAAAAPTADGARFRPSFWRAALIVLTCAAVALAALLVTEWVRGPAASGRQSLTTGAASSGSASTAALRSAALQAAIDEGPTLFSYDYRTLDNDLKKARAVTTGAFTTQYDQVSVPAVKPLAAKYQVVVTAKVLAASVVNDANPKAIKVMLFLDQVVKNTQLAAPRLDANRTVLTMVPTGPKGTTWKVAGVDAI